MGLDDLIQNELAEGEAPESGHFTISLEAMLARMQMQGTGEGWWLSRLVQSAVAAGCLRLEIRPAGILVFETRSPWSAEEIYQGLTHPERRFEPWLEHLRRGLWVCGWQHRLAWQFRVPGRELRFQDGQLRLEEYSGHETCLSIHTHLDESNLRAAAHPCPIQLYWNSTPIDGIDTIRPDLLARSQPEVELKLTVSCAGNHLLHWVEDGLILQTEPLWPELLPTQLKVWGYADAAGLPRDASGYGLIQGPAFKQRSLEIQKALARQLQDLQPLAPQPRRTSRLAPLVWGARSAGATWGAGWWGTLAWELCFHVLPVRWAWSLVRLSWTSILSPRQSETQTGSICSNSRIQSVAGPGVWTSFPSRLLPNCLRLRGDPGDHKIWTVNQPASESQSARLNLG